MIANLSYLTEYNSISLTGEAKQTTVTTGEIKKHWYNLVYWRMQNADQISCVITHSINYELQENYLMSF